jgi:hypothetical protein
VRVTSAMPAASVPVLVAPTEPPVLAVQVTATFSTGLPLASVTLTRSGGRQLGAHAGGLMVAAHQLDLGRNIGRRGTGERDGIDAREHRIDGIGPGRRRHGPAGDCESCGVVVEFTGSTEPSAAHDPGDRASAHAVPALVDQLHDQRVGQLESGRRALAITGDLDQPARRRRHRGMDKRQGRALEPRGRRLGRLSPGTSAQHPLRPPPGHLPR